jgi:hypothetical protein
MRAAIDMLILGAITVVVSLFLLGLGSRDRDGLPWDIRNVTDDILVIGTIMVFLSLFLVRW